MADPNQPYVPETYPRMLYVTPDQSTVVHSEEEEMHARQRGYTDFTNIDPAKDGLEVRSREELIDIACALTRANVARTDVPDLIDGIRKMRALEAERLTKLAEEASAAAASEEPAAPPEPGAPKDPPGPTVDMSQSVTEDDLRAMDEEGLRGFITARLGRKPHPATKPKTLLSLAVAALHPAPIPPGAAE